MKLKELLNENKTEGLYVAVKFSDECVDRILDYCDSVNIPNVLNRSDFHSTLAYSRKPVPDFSPESEIDVVGKPKGFEIWPSEPNAFKKEKTYCLVMKFDCDYMTNRFNEIMSMGATYDYDKYQPHITLSYDVGEDFDTSVLPDIAKIGTISIVSEYSEKLDFDKTYS